MRSLEKLDIRMLCLRRIPNYCKLMWEGVSKEPSFEKFVVEQCRTDAAAKKLLTERGVGHYWDIGTAASTDD